MIITTQEQCAGCWVATNEDYDGPGSPIGSSSHSELDAIDALIDQLRDREEMRATK